MALQIITFDPAAAPALTPDEVVAKVNAAATDITRAGSVDPAARPIELAEVGTAELAAAAVTAVKLSSAAARDNLDALPHVDRKYVRTNPVAGQYKIIHFQRNNVGLLEVEYDDVAVV